MTSDAPQDALGRFRALVMADEALADALSQAADDDGFVALALCIAHDCGLALDAATVRAAITPDPLGLARWTGAPAGAAVFSKHWPPRQWLPAQVAVMGDRPIVDWLHFGAKPLTAPFFEDSIRRALARPFNRMFRYRMAIGDLLDDAARQESLTPSGFIFHMSRCGSTLVSQMLAALAHNVVISEAAAIDAVVQLSRACPDLTVKRQRPCLAAIVAAFGRRRSGRERHYFIKLDSWHALALPLFRRAFPSVPWVFLYRDPVEVLVSQMRQRGAQMVPELVSPGLYGIDGAEGMTSEVYCARVLTRICQAAVDGYSQGGGLLINYRELPGAVDAKILPHFGVASSEQECETMMRAALYDAKAPSFEFASDSETKQRQASELVRAQADRHLGAVYRRLEQLRAEGPAR
jgi:hypothetical protein